MWGNYMCQLMMLSCETSIGLVGIFNSSNLALMGTIVRRDIFVTSDVRIENKSRHSKNNPAIPLARTDNIHILYGSNSRKLPLV